MDRITLYLTPIIILVICALLSTTTFAESERPPAFTGLKSVYVDAPLLDPEVEEGGMNSRQLKKDLERRLKSAGIQVLSDDAYNRFKFSKGYPMARLNISISYGKMTSEGLDFYALTVQAMQQVFLAHKTSIKMWTPTWEVKKMIVGSSPADIQPHITEAVGLFVKDYLSENSP